MICHARDVVLYCYQLPVASSLVWLWHSDICSVPGFVCLCVFGLSNCVAWGPSTLSSSWVLVSFSRLGFFLSQINSLACLLSFSTVQASIYRGTRPWDLLTCKTKIKAFKKMSSWVRACFIINQNSAWIKMLLKCLSVSALLLHPGWWGHGLLFSFYGTIKRFIS